jgi:hypothetical protein
MNRQPAREPALGELISSSHSTFTPATGCTPASTRREESTGMDTLTEPTAIGSRYRPLRSRSAGYWLATAAVVGELGLGGIWDIARLPFVRDLLTALTVLSWALRPPSRRMHHLTAPRDPASVASPTRGQARPLRVRLRCGRSDERR